MVRSALLLPADAVRTISSSHSHGGVVCKLVNDAVVVIGFVSAEIGTKCIMDINAYNFKFQSYPLCIFWVVFSYFCRLLWVLLQSALKFVQWHIFYNGKKLRNFKSLPNSLIQHDLNTVIPSFTVQVKWKYINLQHNYFFHWNVSPKL